MSYLKLKSTFPQMPFVRSTDMAFCIGQQKIAEDFFQKKYGYLPSDFIAVVVRYTQIGDLGMLPETVQQQLNSRVTEYMSQYPQSFYLVVIQTEKDRLPSYELVRQVRQNCKVDCIEEHDPYLSLIHISAAGDFGYSCLTDQLEAVLQYCTEKRRKAGYDGG